MTETVNVRTSASLFLFPVMKFSSFGTPDVEAILAVLLFAIRSSAIDC